MMDVLISRFLSLLAILWWKQIETFIDIQIVKRISHDWSTERKIAKKRKHHDAFSNNNDFVGVGFITKNFFSSFKVKDDAMMDEKKNETKE